MTKCLFLAFPLAFLAGAVSADELVVLETTAGHYDAGDIILTGAGIRLNPNESVVLMSASGKLVELTGPFSGLPEGKAPDQFDLRGALHQLVRADFDEPVRMGAVRGATTDPEELQPTSLPLDSRISPWPVHIGIPGAQCVVEDHRVSYWREAPIAPMELSIQLLSDGRDVTVPWSAETHELAWPQELPLVDGETYLLRPGNTLRSTSIRIVTIPARVKQTDRTAAAWLAANGCVQQARILMAHAAAGSF